MDLVWICRNGDNEELRFSMRSAIQNLEHRQVWVIGGKPNWYQGPFIPVHQRPGKKYENAKSNLQRLISDHQISNEFVLMNDDFFVLRPTELSYYYSGTLAERIERNQKLSPNAAYTQKLIQTKKMLEKIGIENPLDYSLHIPMKMDKAGLQRSLSFPMIRSAYGNLQAVGGEKRSDVKIYAGKFYEGMSYEINENSDFISTMDQSFDEVRDDVLNELFPEPTIFER